MRRWTAVELILLACVAGCDERGSIGLGFDPNSIQISWTDLQFGRRNDVDVLFVVADSPGMAPKQASLIEAVSTFADQIDTLGHTDAPRHFHFGVITADLGSGPIADGECAAPGDDGVLVELGRMAPLGCQPPGDRFIDLDQATPGDNLPPGQDLAATLGCMMAVGDTGCGFVQPLEAAYRALAGNHPTNAGFLRQDALLVVVLVTDQDDCSAPTDSSLFDPSPNVFGPLSPFRCAAAGMVCGNPPHPPTLSDGMPHTDCAATGGMGVLFGLERYRGLFFTASGLKRNPNDVRLVLISGPASPVQVGDGGSGQAVLLPSCTEAGNPSLGALPAVRLAALGTDSPRVAVASICAAGGDEYALDTIPTSLAAEDGASPCLPAPIANPGDPNCEVSDGTNAIPSCGQSGDATPCWELISQPDCLPIVNPRSRTTDRLALAIRSSLSPPATVTGRCQVLLPAN